MITALTRACPLCHRPLPDPPAPPMCDACGRLAVPSHADWPPTLKWWLISDLASRRFLPWLSEQTVFEQILRDALVNGGAGTRPNPRGVRFTGNTPTADLYPHALVLATAWRDAGSPIARAIDLQRSA